MSDLVLDASLALQWFLEDESDRQYSLAILDSLSEKTAAVPILWFYEVGNGLLMAYRRKRITIDQITGFLTRLQALPIEAVAQSTSEIFGFPALAQSSGLTNYDAAYLAIAIRLQLPMATSDSALRRAAASVGVQILAV